MLRWLLHVDFSTLSCIKMIVERQKTLKNNQKSDEVLYFINKSQYQNFKGALIQYSYIAIHNNTMKLA